MFLSKRRSKRLSSQIESLLSHSSLIPSIPEKGNNKKNIQESRARSKTSYQRKGELILEENHIKHIFQFINAYKDIISFLFVNKKCKRACIRLKRFPVLLNDIEYKKYVQHFKLLSLRNSYELKLVCFHHYNEMKKTNPLTTQNEAFNNYIQIAKTKKVRIERMSTEDEMFQQQLIGMINKITIRNIRTNKYNTIVMNTIINSSSLHQFPRLERLEIDFSVLLSHIPSSNFIKYVRTWVIIFDSKSILTSEVKSDLLITFIAKEFIEMIKKITTKVITNKASIVSMNDMNYVIEKRKQMELKFSRFQFIIDSKAGETHFINLYNKIVDLFNQLELSKSSLYNNYTLLSFLSQKVFYSCHTQASFHPRTLSYCSTLIPFRPFKMFQFVDNKITTELPTFETSPVDNSVYSIVDICFDYYKCFKEKQQIVINSNNSTEKLSINLLQCNKLTVKNSESLDFKQLELFNGCLIEIEGTLSHLKELYLNCIIHTIIPTQISLTLISLTISRCYYIKFDNLPNLQYLTISNIHIDHRSNSSINFKKLDKLHTLLMKNCSNYCFNYPFINSITITLQQCDSCYFYSLTSNPNSISMKDCQYIHLNGTFNFNKDQLLIIPINEENILKKHPNTSFMCNFSNTCLINDTFIKLQQLYVIIHEHDIQTNEMKRIALLFIKPTDTRNEIMIKLNNKINQIYDVNKYDIFIVHTKNQTLKTILYDPQYFIYLQTKMKLCVCDLNHSNEELIDVDINNSFIN
ncbi:hypothetical protein QTN25_007659 [Entamoeba marina]